MSKTMAERLRCKCLDGIGLCSTCELAAEEKHEKERESCPSDCYHCNGTGIDLAPVVALVEVAKEIMEAAKYPIDDAYKGKVEGQHPAHDHVPYYWLATRITAMDTALAPFVEGE